MLANAVLLNPTPLAGVPAPLRALGLSGVVYGTLANDPALLAALGEAVRQPPYKAPPRAPVLFMKPRNALAASGAAVPVPTDPGTLRIDASLGIVIGRTACRVAEADALEHVAGWVAVADLGVPHASYYRPGLRFKARDRSCVLGPAVAPRAAVADPDALAVRVSVDGRTVQSASTSGRLRPVARLLADVTEFMTLRPGDVLLLGASHGAPEARAGQAFAVEIDGLARLEGTLVAEEDAA